jgi:subtilisin family serine protease/subtilisin-like proprotein convertase family protein
MKLFRALVLAFSSLFFTQAAEPIPFAPAPNDTYFPEQWYLDGLATNTTRIAFDINARSAWSLSRGEGVTIAIVDTGVDLAHRDLTNQANPALHWNFEADLPVGDPPADNHNHGTPVAGLAVAEGNNKSGVIGIAPDAEFASWVIYRTNGAFVPSSQLVKMFQFKMDEVAVQNHSWVRPGIRLTTMTAEENLAISNAVHRGRGGLGVVMIRGAGNGREQGRNVNEDSYLSDPRVITVAGTQAGGRVASYSTPGSAILVSAPGGDGLESLMTTDRTGQLGFNQIIFQTDLNDYVFGSLGFTGTSAAAPLVSGTAALMLSANPNLSVRDIQHLLVISTYQPDFEDPNLQTNGVGLQVSPNTGFGVVNAGTAVQWATMWPGLPPQSVVSNTVQTTNAIPDAGLRVMISGVNIPPDLGSIIALPSLGIMADEPTGIVPLVHVGRATTSLETNLTGKAALIQRGGADFSVKIGHAADAGAQFAIVYNDRDTNSLQIMGGTDFVPIPAVFISQRHGEALAALTSNSTVNAQITLEKIEYEFAVTNSLITEHVLLHLEYFHELRGDARVTLVSPVGTRSILQRLGDDQLGFDGRWTFMSTHHFYESSVGVWRLEVSDMANNSVGFVRGATLEIRGIPIVDTDRDALDDDWERAAFSNLDQGPTDDPDLDGYTNFREQTFNFNPRSSNSTLEVSVSKWSESYVRLNWPARNGALYEVLGASDLAGEFQSFAFVTGGFPRAAYFGRLDQDYRFYQVREVEP